MKLIAIGVTTALLTLPAAAQDVSLGYSHFMDSIEGNNIATGALVGSLSQHFKLTRDWSVVPQIRAGIGIVDDNQTFHLNNITQDMTLKMKYFVSVDAKLQYQLDERWYAYLMPSYARTKLRLSSSGYSAENSDSEFGIGGGLGVQIAGPNFMELSYQSFDGTNVFSLSYHYRY